MPFQFSCWTCISTRSIGLLFERNGLNLGIDFTGGILMEIHTEQPANLGAMRDKLNHQGFGEVSLQNIGGPNDVMIRIQVAKDEEQAKVTAQVKSATWPSNCRGEYRLPQNRLCRPDGGAGIN